MPIKDGSKFFFQWRYRNKYLQNVYEKQNQYFIHVCLQTNFGIEGSKVKTPLTYPLCLEYTTNSNILKLTTRLQANSEIRGGTFRLPNWVRTVVDGRGVRPDAKRQERCKSGENRRRRPHVAGGGCRSSSSSSCPFAVETSRRRCTAAVRVV